MQVRVVLGAVVWLGVGCAPASMAVFGEGDPASTTLEVMLTADDGLNAPTDLAFDADVEGRLWVVSKRDDSVTIVDNAGTDAQTSEHRIDPYALHFMEKVSSIAFGQPGTFATCQESRNTYNGTAPGDDFTGPSLWSNDLDIFGASNPEAVEFLTDLFGFPADLGSHLDMQHETPLCTGIAWSGEGNRYFVFDGLNETIESVDFVEDHGPGYDDHSDGITVEYAGGDLGYVKGVPNHMLYDAASGLVTIADPANARVVQLDVNSGERGRDLPVAEPGTTHYRVTDATFTDLVSGHADLIWPSGLAQVDGTLFVSDHATGEIWAFDAVDGTLLGRYDTGRGPEAIKGLVAPSLEELWFVDSASNLVFRLTP